MNDGAHVEQKSWSRVREPVSHTSFNTVRKPAAQWDPGTGPALTNYLLLLQSKLICRTRHGTRVTREHDKLATAYQRATRYPRIAKRLIVIMNAHFKKIRVMALYRKILALTAELDTPSRHKNKIPAPALDIPTGRS